MTFLMTLKDKLILTKKSSKVFSNNKNNLSMLTVEVLRILSPLAFLYLYLQEESESLL